MTIERLFKMLEKWLAPLWAVVILVVCTAPIDDMSIDPNVLVPHADKIVHLLMYLVFQILMMRHNLKFGNRLPSWVIFIVVIGYGFLIECLQGYFLEGRFFENYDIIANITGAFIGTLFINRKKS